MLCFNNLNNQNLGSLIIRPEILDIIKKIKIPKSVVSKLRTVSTSYYESFNSIYLKRFKNSRVEIQMYMRPWTTKRQAQVSVWNWDKKLSLGTIISNENINKFLNVGYFFHNLSLNLHAFDQEIREPELEFIQLDPIISSLCPHINEILVFPSAKYPSGELMDSLRQFFKQFSNLEKIIYGRPIGLFYLFPANVSSNIKIEFPIEDYQLDQLPTLLAQSNLFFVFNMKGDKVGELMPRVQNLLKKYKQVIPARFKVDLMVRISKVEEMIILTKICSENQKYIQSLFLNINFRHQRLLSIEDQTIMKDCLLKLSGNIIELKLLDVKLDLLSGVPVWPKLTKLLITGYKDRLEILKRCPELNTLQLEVNMDSSIFHNKQNTEEENLQQYFGHLKNLRTIALVGFGQKSEHIKTMLQNIVPRETRFWVLNLMSYDEFL